jgi:hypothetical protein
MFLFLNFFIVCQQAPPPKEVDMPVVEPKKRTSEPTMTEIPKPEYTQSIVPIPDDIKQKIIGVTWKENCPVQLDELALVTVSHWNQKLEHTEGNLIVAQIEAENIAAIFNVLYDAKFPIVSMKLMHNFNGSDDASMKANNTSAFNCRSIKGTSRFSQHSYGQAIDINPLWNPWVKGNIVDPPEGSAYLDRSQKMDGLIKDNDIVVQTFAKYGWKWGGHWTTRKDYQHFSTSGK